MHQRTIRKQVITGEKNSPYGTNTKTQMFTLILNWNEFRKESEMVGDLGQPNLDSFNTGDVFLNKKRTVF
jgi:hypothetical protein